MVGATVADADGTFATVESDGVVVLLATGNAEISRRPGSRAIPVTGLPPSELAVAWRPGDDRAVIRDLLEALPPEPLCGTASSLGSSRRHRRRPGRRGGAAPGARAGQRPA